MAIADDQRDIVHTAFGHPLRRQIMAVLWHSEMPVSPNQISDVLSGTLSVVSYHVRRLKTIGAVNLDGERPVRGSTEHFYVLSEVITRVSWATEELDSMIVTVPVNPERDPEVEREAFDNHAKDLLDRSERTIVNRHNGWNGHKRMTRREIGESLGISTEQVRQIERLAIQKVERARQEADKG